MRTLLLLLFCPLLATAQLNPSFVATSNLSYSKLEASGDGMFGFEEGGKFGYLDKTGKVVIPADYLYDGTTKTIPYFSKGYVKLRKDGKYGLLDKNGKVAIPFEYESLTLINSLSSHAFGAKKDGTKTVYGVVTTQNKTTVPFVYEDMTADSNLVNAKQNGKWGVMDLGGKILVPFEYTTALSLYPKDKTVRTVKDGKVIFLDLAGKSMFEKVSNVYTIYGASQGMVMCVVNSKYGYLDMKGEEVIITKYDYGYSFESNGLAKVGRKITPTGYTYKYGFIDKRGTEVIPIQYETIGSFSNGLVYAKDAETNRYGYLDRTAKWVIQPTFLEAFAFDATGGAWVKMTDGKYHYINKTGKDLGSLSETSYKNFASDGYAVYEHADNPYVLIDKNGKTLKTIEDGDGIYSFAEGIAGYKSKSTGKYGFIDYTGKLIGTAIYDGFGGFNDGITRVETKVAGKSKYGYLNSNGQLVLPMEYDDLRVFRSGWGLMKKDGNFYYVDKNGNQKDPPRKYDDLTEFRSGFSMGTINGTNTKTYYYINTDLKEAFSIEAKEGYLFWDNVAVVKRNTDYELVNKKGEVFKTLTGIPTLKFSSDNMLAIKQNGKWGFMNDQGTIIVPATYDSCESFKYGYGRIKTGTKWGIVDKSGNVVFETKYDNILSGENGVFIFYDNGWGAMDKTGKVLFAPKLNTITPFEKDRALARLGKSFTIVKSPLIK